jgi:hypothetical protein
MNIFNLFSNTEDTTTFYTLYNKLKDWKKAQVYPYTYNLPKTVSFPKDFWDRIVGIQKNTLKDGNERAISIYWVDGELVLSPISKGDSRSVNNRGNISVKYEKHPTRKGYLRKEIILNSNIYKKTDIYYKKVPKKIEIEYLFNIHTHPLHRNSNGVEYYNFFSAQDIKSFITSNVVITGLVTNKFWLLFRTNKTPNSLEYLQDRDITIEKLKKLEIGVYSGEFNKILEKV